MVAPKLDRLRRGDVAERQHALTDRSDPGSKGTVRRTKKSKMMMGIDVRSGCCYRLREEVAKSV